MAIINCFLICCGLLTTSSYNPDKIVLRHGIFSQEEDINPYPWPTPSPLKLTPHVKPLPLKLKHHFPLFYGGRNVTMNEHFHAFSNACMILKINEMTIACFCFQTPFKDMLLPCLLIFLMNRSPLGMSLHIGSPSPLESLRIP